MKNLFIITSLLTFLPTAVIADSCKIKNRYTINGEENLEVGDVLELRIGNSIITKTLVSDNVSSSVWPAVLAKQVNLNLNANKASAGSVNIYTSKGQYVEEYTPTGNIIDVFQDNTPVSLTLNGIDYSSQLTVKSLPNGTYSGEANLNHFHAGKTRNGVLYVKNNSEVDVNVKVDFKEFDGSNFSGSYTARYGFTSGNDPVANFVPLAAGTLGDIVFQTRNSSFPSYAKIKWTSTQCVDKPLSVQLEQTWTAGGMSAFNLEDF